MTTHPVRILVVGDPYFDAAALARSLKSLEGIETLDSWQIDEVMGEAPRTESEGRLREYAGSASEVAAHLDGHDVLVVHGAPVSDEALASPGLRLVCCARGGPVNVDVESATRHGIPVTGTPGKNALAVAELTLAFILALLRGIPSSAQALREGEAVPQSTFDGRPYFGTELAGTRLGLVGLGNVGRRVQSLTEGLHMKVAAYDPYVDPADSLDVELQTLEQVLASSDVVSLHARGSSEGTPLMGAREFALMRDGSFFVNTSREQLVDEAALIDVLDSGKLAGAALDVIELDGSHPRNPLLDHPKVMVTPHIGGATEETLRRGSEMVAETVTALIEGLPLPYLMNPGHVAGLANAGG